MPSFLSYDIPNEVSNPSADLRMTMELAMFPSILHMSFLPNLGVILSLNSLLSRAVGEG